MASSSDRRSASSGPSKRRKSVYISGDQTRHVAETPPGVGGRASASRRSSGQPPALGRGRAPHSGGPPRQPHARKPHAASPAEHVAAVPRGPLLRDRPRQRSKEADEFAAVKRDERQQRHRSRAFRNRSLVVGAAVLVVVALVGWITLYRSQAFAVTDVQVVGNSRVPTSRLLEIAGAPPGTTLLRAPTAQMTARLGADPWVASAKVERIWPDTLRIVVEERVPVAAVEMPDKAQWIVDGAGVFVAPKTALPKVALPLVRELPSLPTTATPGMAPENPELANAVAVLAALDPSLRSQVVAVDAHSVDETSVYTASGLQILFGAARQMTKKDYLARRILTDQKGKVVFIDVRTVERPVWRGLGK